jgi:hypothetical protein
MSVPTRDGPPSAEVQRRFPHEEGRRGKQQELARGFFAAAQESNLAGLEALLPTTSCLPRRRNRALAGRRRRSGS